MCQYGRIRSVILVNVSHIVVEMLQSCVTTAQSMYQKLDRVRLYDLSMGSEEVMFYNLDYGGKCYFMDVNL